SEGEIIYANPAFATAARRCGTDVSGQRWDKLVVGTSLASSEPDDFLDVMDSDSFDVVEVGGDRRVISSTVSNLHTNDDAVQGTVRVVRDHTDMIAARTRRALSLVQTVDAFVHAIERRDPFLLGHTKGLRTHVIAMGKRLGLSTDDLANLALAASLSQIGKIFIPDDILTKPDRHDPKEERVMRDHILHAVGILGRIDFEAPVADVLIQMHERLDGTGYPHGISGTEISLSARILAVADVFCARTAPRSYRDRLSAGKALYHLANNDQRYDLKVVAALAEIVGQNEKIEKDDEIEKTFLDASIWQQRQSDHVHEPA
ncbi:MAG: HD-GYP domain-containing protein, partial [Geminicoccaceae bacterium]